MALDFGTTMGLAWDTRFRPPERIVVNRAPMTEMIWHKPPNENGAEWLFGQQDYDSANYFQIFGGTFPNIRFRARSTAAVGTSEVSGLVSGQWSCIVGVEHSTASRFVWIDGVASTEETTAVIPGHAVMNQVGISHLSGAFGNGPLAESAIWNRALSDTEIARVTQGYSALFLPNGLIWYAPCWGHERRDIVGGKYLRPIGGMAQIVSHPLITYPSWFNRQRDRTVNPHGPGVLRRRIVKAPAVSADLMDGSYFHEDIRTDFQPMRVVSY